MAQTPGTAGMEGVSMENFSSVEELKAALLGSLEGLNRGIFGVQNARKVEVESLLQLFEAVNPSPRPTDDLDKIPIPDTISVDVFASFSNNERSAVKEPKIL